MGKKAQKQKKTESPAPAAAETKPQPAAAKAEPAKPKPEPAKPAAAKAEPAKTETKAEPAAKPVKKAAAKKVEPAAPAEEEWTLVTAKRRTSGKKKNKKIEEQEKEQNHHDGQAGFGGRAGQPRRDFHNKRQHVPDEIIPIEHSTAAANVILFVTNEEEEDAIRKILEDRPFKIAAVATLKSVANFANPERLAKVRVVEGIEDTRAMMKELGVGLFVLPVDDDRLPAPRMSDEVSAILDVSVHAGAYALTVSLTPLESSPADNFLFFAAVPTQESIQLLVNTLGVVDDKEVRQDFEIHGFDVPEKAGLFDIYTSLMNSAVKKNKMCTDAEIIPNGDQFVQDVAANTQKAAHYPVFTVSFKVGRLNSYKSRQSKRTVYEIVSDDVIPDTLRNIFILLGAPVHTKLTIIVCKYQSGDVKYDCADPDKKVDVEFEKIIYSYNSLTERPVYELYLPRYVDPAAVAIAPATPAAAAAPAPATEEASK